VLKTRSITAGNSSGINDAACALILASSEKVGELGAEPLARIVDSCVSGVDPEQMGLGPVAAISKLLSRNKLTLKDIDLIEINEAFAAQALACIRELGMDGATVNPNGGAIALGHPLGCTGARLVTTLVHEMGKTKARHGLVTLCVGVGQGVATLLEGV